LGVSMDVPEEYNAELKVKRGLVIETHAST